jgi:histidine triad (HIT) family protein
MDDCLFCKIIEGKIPSSKVYEDEKVYAFRDINPQAPVHVLVVPKAHYSDVKDAAKDQALLGYLFAKCGEIAESEGLKNGFRLITNCGDDACQSVHHMHVHILGGAKLTDKMG